MRFKKTLFLNIFLSLFFLLFLSSLGSARSQVELAEKGLKQPERCENAKEIVLSGAYSPYSVHIIKAEVAGHIKRINAREGQILKKNTPIMEIDCAALEKQLMSLKEVLKALKLEKGVLERNLQLSRKKFQRYLKLKKEGHIEQQLVEDMETQVNSSRMTLIENRRHQAETRRAIAQLEDQIKKSRPCFDRPLYVSQNFKEVYETVVPGEKLSRLLDISKAKIHLVLSLPCFKRLKEALKEGRTLNFSLVLPDGKEIRARGQVEKLKVDPDNSYLYSYGFDLVFAPIKGLLWGQVVRIRIGL